MKNIQEITKKLEQGVREVFGSGAYKEYLEFMTRFHAYSVNNTFLIWAQRPDASLVAGYKAWKDDFGRQVRKGEKAIKIIAPIPHKTKKETVDENGYVSEKEVTWMGYRAVNVFDVSQTEGKDIPRYVHDLVGSVDGFEVLEKMLIGLSPVPVGYEEIEGGVNGYYSNVEKRIVIKAGMAEQQTIETLVHEISHAILHDRDTGEEAEADRRTKEVQAESVAYIVCSSLGLDTADYSFGYVAGWSGDKEVKELTASMEVIKKTASEIIEALKIV